jgi:hypothetical protein
VRKAFKGNSATARKIIRSTWVRRGFLWFVFPITVIIAAAIVAAFFIDEPLRKRMEADLNQRLKGYTVRIGRLDFHPIGFSLDLEDSVVSQTAHPDPPVASIPLLTASVEWRALLFGGLVADFRIDRPRVHINLKHLQQEAKDEVPVEEKGWQEALETIYPLKIDHFEINGAELTYVDQGPFRPLHLRNINLTAENIRNVRSPENVYPSAVRLEADVFEKGKLVLDGNADFLAEPQVAFKAEIDLRQIELDYFKPVTQRQNFNVSGGTLSGKGRMEYAARTRTIEIPTVTVDGVKLDYIQKTETSATEKAAKKIDQAAKEHTDDPTFKVNVNEVRITQSELGFINRAKDPGYRVYLDDADLSLKNFSNQSEERPGVAAVRGRFMGDGDARADVKFHADPKGPDLDLTVAIESTDMRRMNDLFRAYGGFDVVKGWFSFYSEILVRDGVIKGYVKPLFKEIDVYDKRQDKEKGLFRKLYEGVIGGISWLLQNTPRDEVATQITVSGKLSNPETSALEVIIGLIQNAFFKAILPGFEREISGGARKDRPAEQQSPSAGDPLAAKPPPGDLKTIR